MQQSGVPCTSDQVCILGTLRHSTSGDCRNTCDENTCNNTCKTATPWVEQMILSLYRQRHFTSTANSFISVHFSSFLQVVFSRQPISTSLSGLAQPPEQTINICNHIRNNISVALRPRHPRAMMMESAADPADEPAAPTIPTRRLRWLIHFRIYCSGYPVRMSLNAFCRSAEMTLCRC